VNSLVRIGALAACAMACSTARAEMILAAQNSTIRGSQSFVVPIDVPAAGQARIDVRDLGWTASLQNLTFTLYSADGELAAAAAAGGPGGQYYMLDGAGAYFAFVSAVAGGPYSLGAVSVRVAFDLGTPPPIPLPGAWVLLLSGLSAAGLFASRRARAV